MNKTTNSLLSENVLIADSFYTRCKGLLGRKDLAKNSCLWIKRCPSVHTFFMRFSIDVVFHDKDLRVTTVVENLKPWRITAPFQYKNNACFEFSAQNISQKIKRGDFLDVRS